ncbi:MAG TPA: hypothetical protein DCZ95_07475 [Verrucomicrobia bacterium]|nr:MAG: hypothetical protein A2X46_16360 [Lentisphaerae bacterium GWF2_57_35]HBA83915.1 hypothetical protein [Verrucomicrobiota bacterium]
MKDITSEFLQALLNASDERKQRALKALHGDDQPLKPVTIEPYHTQREIAKLLKINPSTLWRWKIPYHQWGGSRRYLFSEVQAYLESARFRRQQSLLQSKEVR